MLASWCERIIERNPVPGGSGGAGFIGCIILESWVLRDVNLTVVEMGPRMVPRMLREKAGGLLHLGAKPKV